MSSDNIQKWHDTQSSIDTAGFSKAFWERHKADLASGNFWADKIKEFRGEPVERLRVAIDNLPLPAAFREGAIAIRALIREKRSNNESYADQLALLYWLAAINSFSVPYSEKLQSTGYNILESIPAQTLQALPFTYSELGYKHLDLLNKTDIKWLIELWGQPHSHNTLLDKHRSIWDDYEERCLAKSKEREIQFTGEINTLMREAQPSNTNYTNSAHFLEKKKTTNGNISMSKLVLVGLGVLVLTILFFI